MTIIHNYNVLDKDFIWKINEIIDSMNYDSSLWLFEDDDLELFELIRTNLMSNNFMKHHINKNTYIVIRCVKASDKKRSYESHFDNYEQTFVVPIKIPNDAPRGELMIWENARRFPKSLIEHIFTKLIFQNIIFRFFMKLFLINKFELLNVQPGDIVSFPGFTTLHYNNPVSSERRSILIHNHKSFKDSYTVQIIEKISKLNVR